MNNDVCKVRSVDDGGLQKSQKGRKDVRKPPMTQDGFKKRENGGTVGATGS